jgi:hypothetical protein
VDDSANYGKGCWEQRAVMKSMRCWCNAWIGISRTSVRRLWADRIPV